MRNSWARCAGTAPALLILLFTVIAQSPAVAANNTSGTWSAVNSWPLIPLHAVLMPDGRVLSYGTKADGTQTGYFIYDVWDPTAPAGTQHVTSQNTTGTDIFCSSQVVLPGGGGVFIAGGDNWTGTGTTNTGNSNSNVFNYGNNTLTRYSNMNRSRWYSSTTVLLNGETYTQGGSGGTDRPEIRDVNGNFRLLQNADTSAFVFMYPHNFIAPDGRIFGIDGNGAMYYVNTSGNGSVSNVGQLSGPTGTDSSAAMFRPGRIIQFGGNSIGARVIDITGGGTPVVTNTANLSTQRRLVTATILADGKVLATGGSEVNNEMTNVNYSAEIWDPSTGQWFRGSNEVKARLYHSTALLLPDATVLVAGGGAPGPQNNTNMEIYYPPYLYDASGAFASRPSISSAPAYIDIGETIAVGLGSTQGISRVVMLKTGSVTHSWNMEQRFVELTFQQNGNQLMAQAPTHAADAPPGYYMLFVLNAAGTPSIARIARVGVAPTPNPQFIPVLANPGNQSGQTGTPAALQLSASDPNGDSLSYSASGLPPGLSINVLTGLISGTPTTAGSFNVVVTASDGINSDSKNFVWNVAQGTPFVLNPLPTPTPALAGAAITFQASVTGGAGVQYKWNFDDGTPETAYSSSSSISHVFAKAGIYYVTVTAVAGGGTPQTMTVVQTVHLPLTTNRPAISGNIAVEDRAIGSDRLWVVNQDNDSVSVFLTSTNAKVAEIPVGSAPRALAITPSGEVWVTNKRSATISVISPASLAVIRTIALPFASQPFGIVAAPTGGIIYVALEGSGRLLKIDAATDATIASLAVGPNPRHVSVTGDGSLVFVSRFITPPLPGESTATVQTPVGVGGEIAVINGSTMTLQQTVTLRHSDKPDFETQGRGIPNYLGAVAISPDGQSAWIPSKQDNIKRGVLRDGPGSGLNFQNTVRAISSRLDLVTGVEDYAARIDHDNSSIASAAVHDQLGIYMFVALETSREVAVVDAHGGWEIFRFIAGRAPQGLALSADGRTLYVSNFMDRSVSVFDISTLLADGTTSVPLVATLSTVAAEKLSAQVLKGKQFFYDARDTRLAKDGYLSCAACHNDGGHDGRVWDLTGFGEGLRNTISLRGRAGAQGFLHWSNNFDEVQDFEGQIRNLSGGTGLMANSDFNAGTRSQTLGDAKAGISSDLDALAAYVASLKEFASSPLRNADGSLTAAAAAGREVFRSKNCASCHGGTAFTNSDANNPQNVGTIRPESGSRLGGPLTGIDIPTLRDVWATGPYLHLGSAATIEDAIRAHSSQSFTATEMSNLVAYVTQIGDQETAAPTNTPKTGSGLAGQYFNNMSLSGAPVLQRVEAVNFGWGSGSPDPAVNADNFSVQWSGFVEATATGSFQFQTKSNDGVRLWVNGVLLIDNWTNHATVDDTSATISLTGNTRYAITMEFYDNKGAAVARLRWKRPGQTAFATIPANRLYPN